MISMNYRYDGKSRQNHELNIHSYIYEEQHPSSASFPVTEEEEREDEDDMYSYQCNLMDHGMLNVNFTDAIAEADGDRIMRSWKFLLLHFFVDGNKSINYSLEAIYLQFQQ